MQDVHICRCRCGASDHAAYHSFGRWSAGPPKSTVEACPSTATFDQSRDLNLAAVAYLSRYRGVSRQHTESDLRVFLIWCLERRLPPLSAQRNDLELYVRWLQDVRR